MERKRASETPTRRVDIDMTKILATLSSATLFLGGCESNPVTGRPQLMLASEDKAISDSTQAYRAMLQPVAKEGEIDSDPATVGRVHESTSRLIAQAIIYRPETQIWKWSVKVIDDPNSANAWCMAGAKMAIYTGLIQQIKPTDDELAQVMGHEISHALGKHSAEKMSRAMAMQVGLGAQAAAIIALELPNSRTAESEADRSGIALAAQGGIRPSCRCDPIGKNGHGGRRRQVANRLPVHPPGAAEAHGYAGRVGATDVALLRGHVAAPDLSPAAVLEWLRVCCSRTRFECGPLR